MATGSEAGSKAPEARNFIAQNGDILFALSVVGIIIMFIIPMPTAFMDILLTTNITFSMVVILVSIYTTEPLEVSVFPSLLLFATLFRLGLNVSTTRLILGQAYAGEVIESFGTFVVAGNYVVGFIIFLIIIVIQYIVITKGAERVAEVAARFTLDAMPGKQMSIDADLNAGIITEEEARRQREKIRKEADFYGAMDGASKFVKGDAIAGIVITSINIVGGLVIGVLQQDMALAEAAQTYTLLTVGDGLVSQIPALLVSSATGMVVTRAAAEGSMGQDMSVQLTGQPKALWIASAVLFLLAFVPGLPTLPFLVLAFLVGAVAFMVRRQVQMAEEVEAEKEEAEAEKEAEAERERGPQRDELSDLIKVDPMEVEVGYNLIPLVLPEQGGDFLDRVAMIRRQTASELGIIVPPVRVLDNLQLDPGVYRIKLKGVEIDRFEIKPDHYLAMESGMTSDDLEGVEAEEPAFGTPAIWIEEDQKDEAEMAGYTVVDPPSVMATHLTEVIKDNAHELLGRQEVKELVDSFEEDYPAVVDELLPDLLTLGEIQKVLQNLLREGIPVNNLLTIMETLADYAPRTKDPDILTEYVRQALCRQITSQYMAGDGKLHAVSLDPELEDKLDQAVDTSDQGKYLALKPQEAQDLIGKIASEMQQLLELGYDPILLTAPNIRKPLKELTRRSLERLIVLSFNELESDVDLEIHGTVK
ncbi:flagellar biosynthesis protein FlhA [Halarsenatibacter silvermanii]|uniref:Flagellar biosynthesis protein FlhA n=1 Tax=Halarsenatibacter silvermanii TaxID=321763 RepID=A0A1G9MJK1_9FIRM|nr:flagellar biosynthesis protein FlhA [Halarsenatibacter silvermanii]SDL74314.1 flagellar biosynthesis protein FlhA [Halarsenatibacter silvermanii]